MWALLYNVSQHLADVCNCLIFKQLLEVPYCQTHRARSRSEQPVDSDAIIQRQSAALHENPG